MAQSLSCPQVADVDSKELWNRAQTEYVPMHMFHDWITSSLKSVAKEHKGTKQKKFRVWSSKNAAPNNPKQIHPLRRLTKRS